MGSEGLGFRVSDRDLLRNSREQYYSSVRYTLNSSGPRSVWQAPGWRRKGNCHHAWTRHHDRNGIRGLGFLGVRGLGFRGLGLKAFRGLGFRGPDGYNSCM